jgi:hypothetical protein
MSWRQTVKRILPTFREDRMPPFLMDIVHTCDSYIHMYHFQVIKSSEVDIALLNAQQSRVQLTIWASFADMRVTLGVTHQRVGILTGMVQLTGVPTDATHRTNSIWFNYQCTVAIQRIDGRRWTRWGSGKQICRQFASVIMSFVLHAESFVNYNRKQIRQSLIYNLRGC